MLIIMLICNMKKTKTQIAPVRESDRKGRFARLLAELNTDLQKNHFEKF